MSYREPLSVFDKKELYEATVEAFKDGFMDEDMFRRHLATLGFNAVEIDREVELHAPTQSKTG